MFWSAARQWAEKAVAAGLLTINDLKIDPGAACTLVGHNEQPSLLPDIGSADPALLAALRRLGWAVLRVPIAPEGIAELVHLGWLDRRQCRQPAVLVDVLIDLPMQRSMLACTLRDAKCRHEPCGRVIVA